MKKEIGSFIDLELESNKEYYSSKVIDKKNIIRLNTARAAIYHAVRCFNVKKVYVPYYECDTVRNFLIKKHIKVKYYNIDSNFKPLIKTNEKDSAIVFVNYYGIMSFKHFDFIKKFNNVIIDNAQAFFFEPIKNAINIYSCRKFLSVPDGSYVIGKNVNKFKYKEDESSDTSLFLLLRKEHGLVGKTYKNRKSNEERLNKSDVRIMSKLTHSLLDSFNYLENIKKRINNFNYARKIFDSINLLDISSFIDKKTVPMVYPLLINKDIIKGLHKNNIFQGHWWEYVKNEVKKDTFEYQLSKYIIPITIDQRYSNEDIKYQYDVVIKLLGK